MKKIPLKLFNTLGRKKQVFKPIQKVKIGLYTCGPTVYWYAHIGNMRTYIFEDILRRVLEYNGYDVNHVMNITDVGHLTSDADSGEDKMEKSAREQGKDIWQLAELYTQAFRDDLKRLNILEPKIWCKATEHIKEQIRMVEALEKRGFTYETRDGVYFDTSKFKDYGKLALLNLEGLKEGARVQRNQEKRNPTDFALWKLSPKNEKRQMEWDSPWGVGFPGWHIECSAMSVKYLGQPFDIHTGGIDHVPIHHTNEIAQVEAATGKKMANFWLHGAFLQIKGGRMGKSQGNIVTVSKLQEEGIDPLSYRYLIMTSHYRSELNFTDESIKAAQTSYRRLKERVREFSQDDTEVRADYLEEYEEKFLSVINDDLNTSEALAVVWDLIRSSAPPSVKFHLIERFDEVLGLRLTEFDEVKIPRAILDLAQKREEFRKEKNFKEADRIRDEIKNMGYIVEDSPDGVIVRKQIS